MSGRWDRFWPVFRRDLDNEVNSSRRRADRLQLGVWDAVLVLLALACVVAVFAGFSAYERQMALEEADAQRGYHITARVVSSELVSTGDVYSTHHVRVTWLDRQGRLRDQTLVVPSARAEGATLRVWVNAAGRASVQRRPDGQALSVAVGTGVLTVGFAVAALTMIYLVAGHALDRYRYIAWQQEWAEVEPQWRRDIL